MVTTDMKMPGCGLPSRPADPPTRRPATAGAICMADVEHARFASVRRAARPRPWLVIASREHQRKSHEDQHRAIFAIRSIYSAGRTG